MKNTKYVSYDTSWQKFWNMHMGTNFYKQLKTINYKSIDKVSGQLWPNAIIVSTNKLW